MKDSSAHPKFRGEDLVEPETFPNQIKAKNSRKKEGKKEGKEEKQTLEQWTTHQQNC